MKTLKRLFLDELAEMYDAENRLNKALPKMIKTADSPELRRVLEHHYHDTAGHIKKVERIFAAFDEAPRIKKNLTVAALLEKGEKTAAIRLRTDTLDAAIIASFQKAEHYEIAAYGTLHAWAEILHNEDATQLIQEILDQKKEADDMLNDLSLSHSLESFAVAESAAWNPPAWTPLENGRGF